MRDHNAVNCFGVKFALSVRQTKYCTQQVAAQCVVDSHRTSSNIAKQVVADHTRRPKWPNISSFVTQMLCEMFDQFDRAWWKGPFGYLVDVQFRVTPML